MSPKMLICYRTINLNHFVIYPCRVRPIMQVGWPSMHYIKYLVTKKKKNMTENIPHVLNESMFKIVFKVM